MKHAYRTDCDCGRCTKERTRRTAQSSTDARRFPQPARTRRPRKTAMERWAEAYDALNGAPESDEDR